ncbi:hypothetical protein D9758_017872 [Tetrapyrgos nigripes]|uniref:Uncharacterized protein n=1 Tax=Tetrapyrgos nigripes TaxID=182062 RepID=A0A8H5C4K3_9AGAR|nr:hypothetical protein D9758_017872 [Tetrapyrgos nigripes]
MLNIMGALLSRIWTRQDRYREFITLAGHRDAILSLSFSLDARFLAVVGLHGIAMYKMSSSPPGGEVTIPHVSTNPQDPKNLFTASAWLLFQNGSRHIVVVGNMNGDVVLWEWRTDHKCFETFIKIPAQASRDGDRPQAPDGQVMFLDVYERIVPDHHHGRIAASFSSRVVTVWSVSIASKEVTEVFRVSLKDSFIPVTVKFLSKLDLLVFKAKSGDICILDQKTGATKGRHIVAGEFLGQVCFNDRQDAFLVWTGKSFEMFSLENRQLLRVFGGNTSQSHLPRQVQFIEEGRLVLGGAETGCALLYDRDSGKLVQSLPLSSRKVQTVTDQASASSKHYFVAIAGSTISESNKVKVFFKLRPTPKVPKAAVICLDDDWTLHMKLPWFFHAFYVACAVLGMAVLCIGLVLLAPIPETVYWLALWLYNLVQQGDTAPVAWTSRQDVVAPWIVVTPPVHFDGGKMAAQGVMGQEVSVVYDGSICVPPECITMGADSLRRTMKEMVISFFRLAVIAPLALAGMVSFAKGTVTLEDLKDIGEELKVITRRIAGYLVLKTPDFLRFTAGFIFTWLMFSAMLAAMAAKYKNYYETCHGREPICISLKISPLSSLNFWHSIIGPLLHCFPSSRAQTHGGNSAHAAAFFAGVSGGIDFSGLFPSTSTLDGSFAMFLSPAAGLMATDYVVIRRRRLRLRTSGINFHAVIAWVNGVWPLMPRFIAAVQNETTSKGWMVTYYLAWLFGFFVSIPSDIFLAMFADLKDSFARDYFGFSLVLCM